MTLSTADRVHQELRPRFPDGKTRSFEVAAVHPDDFRAAVCCDGGLWLLGPDRPTAQLLSNPSFQLHRYPYWGGLAFSPDGSRLVAVGRMNQGRVPIWTLPDAGPPVVLEHSGEVLYTAFSADGQTLITLCKTEEKGALKGGVQAARWRLNPDGRWKELGTPLSLGLTPSLPVLDTTGDIVLSGRNTSEAVVYDARKDRLEVLAGHGELLRALALSPDGHFVATGSRDGPIRIWAIQEKRDPWIHRSPKEVAGGLLSARGDRVAVWYQDSPTIHVFGTDGKKLVDESPPGEEKAPSAVTFSKDGQRVAVGYPSGRAWVLTVGEPPALRVPAGSEGAVSSIALSTDGELAAIGYRSGFVRVASASDPGAFLGMPFLGPIHTLAFDPRGRRVTAVQGEQRQRWRLLLFGPEDGSSLSRLRVLARKESTGIPAVSADGSRSAAVDEHGLLQRWTTADDWQHAEELGTDPWWPSHQRAHPVDCPPAVLLNEDGSVALTAGAGRGFLWPGGPRWFHSYHCVTSLRADGGAIVTVNFFPVYSSNGPATGPAGHIFPADGLHLPITIEPGEQLLAITGDGRLALLKDTSGTTLRLIRLDWQGLLDQLRGATTACLSPQERTLYLREPPEVAAERAKECASRPRAGRAGLPKR